MKTNPVTRRMFLQGAGGLLLSIPTLSSLLTRPQRARAQAVTPVRYVQWVTDHGQFDANFWPAAQPTEVAVDNVRVRALSSISGRMSMVLGEDFDGLRAKLNVVRGLDLMVTPTFHNACVPTCASWPREDNHIPAFSHSVDSILEKSPKVYPTPVRVAALRMTPGVSSSYKWGSFSWTTHEGKPFKLPAHSTSEAALNAVFTGGSGANDPVQASRLRLTDQVLEDYRSVSNRSSIGAADKQQLSHYMDLLADVQSRMKIETASCSRPGQEAETDFNVLHQNGTDIAVAALLCGATRVVAYHCYQGSPSSYDEETFHSWAHNDAAKHGTMMVWRYKQLARLLRTLDQFRDPDGKTVLDNSMVYAGNELSEPGHGGRHLQNMPIIVAGSAGGKLSTGNYIDFQSRLMNSILITAFAVMGLEPADYERNGVEGFGDYQGSNPGKYAAYVTTAERRKPLPFLFQG